jgi:hypothetical protein
MAEEKTGEASVIHVSFNPAAWAAQHLDLLHAPDYQASAALKELGIAELKAVYQMLVEDYSFSDWPDFVWEVLSSQIDAELRQSG